MTTIPEYGPIFPGDSACPTCAGENTGVRSDRCAECGGGWPVNYDTVQRALRLEQDRTAALLLSCDICTGALQRTFDTTCDRCHDAECARLDAEAVLDPATFVQVAPGGVL